MSDILKEDFTIDIDVDTPFGDVHIHYDSDDDD